MHLRLHYFRSNCPDFPPQIGSRGYHKTAKPALEILADWRFSGPTEGQKGGCRMTRLADFELNFEGKIRKKVLRRFLTRKMGDNLDNPMR